MKTLKITAFLLIMGLTSNVFGQPFGNPPGPRHEKIRERIRMVKIWKLTEELNLSEEQSEKFFPAYNKFQADREAIEDKRRETIKQLDELTLSEDPSGKQINSLLDRLESLDQELRDKKAGFRIKLEDILTTRQIGRLYLFEMHFQRQIQEIIRDARMEMQGRKQRRRFR